jgi:hypothetical protein
MFDRRRGARGVANAYHEPERREAVERIGEGVLANAVVDHRHAFGFS